MSKFKHDGALRHDAFGQLSEKAHKPNESLLLAAAGLNDHSLEDIEIPATDIYTQEFFFYAYTYLTSDKGNDTRGY